MKKSWTVIYTLSVFTLSRNLASDLNVKVSKTRLYAKSWFHKTLPLRIICLGYGHTSLSSVLCNMYLYRSGIDVIIVALWFEPVLSGTESSPTGHSFGKVGHIRCNIFNNRPFTWKRCDLYFCPLTSCFVVSYYASKRKMTCTCKGCKGSKGQRGKPHDGQCSTYQKNNVKFGSYCNNCVTNYLCVRCDCWRKKSCMSEHHRSNDPTER